jgi:large subunit ribosomal protein L22
MEASAQLKNNPRTNNNAGSPRKVRLVVDQIRGLDVDKALSVLKFSQKSSKIKMEKLLLCAMNNWRQKYDLDPADHSLYIKTIYVDGGKTMKRFQPAPHGRAHRIRKRTNHITLIVDSRNPVKTEEAVKEQEA